MSEPEGTTWLAIASSILIPNLTLVPFAHREWRNVASVVWANGSRGYGNEMSVTRRPACGDWRSVRTIWTHHSISTSTPSRSLPFGHRTEGWKSERKWFVCCYPVNSFKKLEDFTMEEHYMNGSQCIAFYSLILHLPFHLERGELTFRSFGYERRPGWKTGRGTEWNESDRPPSRSLHIQSPSVTFMCHSRSEWV